MSERPSRLPVPNTKQPLKFVFERQIPVVAITTKRKATDLKAEKFDRSTPVATFQLALQDNVAVSPSGRSLSQILNLSCPDELSSYHIDSVAPLPGWGMNGVLVKYSHTQGTEAVDRLREKEALERKVEELERVSLEKRNAEELMMKWQTAMLVLQAFGTFVWSHISDGDRKELAKFGLMNFHDLMYAKWGTHSPARSVAWRIYDKIDVGLKSIAERITMSKREVNEQRKLLAHPSISNERVKKFLAALGDGSPELQPMEVRLFEYLKTATNSEVNISAARRG